MKLKFLSVLFCCFTAWPLLAQEWSLELSSVVDIRSLKLSNKVEKTEKGLAGANIALYEGSALVREVRSDANGEFVIPVPANREFMLVVSYQDYNAKKFIVSTKGVPSSIASDEFRPSFSIGGFTMAKPLPGIDYSVLKEPLVRVMFIQNRKKFDDEEAYTERMLDRLAGLAASENDLIEKFVNANRAGDAALAKNDCPLAKLNYEKAISLIPGEQYPVIQLEKVGLCLKEKEVLAASQKTAEVKPKASEELVKTEKDLQVKVEESTDEKLKLLAAEKSKKENAKRQASPAATAAPAVTASKAPAKAAPAIVPAKVDDPVVTAAPSINNANNNNQASSKSVIVNQKTGSAPSRSKKYKKGDSKYTIRPAL